MQRKQHVSQDDSSWEREAGRWDWDWDPDSDPGRGEVAAAAPGAGGKAGAKYRRVAARGGSKPAGRVLGPPAPPGAEQRSALLGCKRRRMQSIPLPAPPRAWVAPDHRNMESQKGLGRKGP